MGCLGKDDAAGYGTERGRRRGWACQGLKKKKIPGTSALVNWSEAPLPQQSTQNSSLQARRGALFSDSRKVNVWRDDSTPSWRGLAGELGAGVGLEQAQLSPDLSIGSFADAQHRPGRRGREVQSAHGFGRCRDLCRGCVPSHDGKDR